MTTNNINDNYMGNYMTIICLINNNNDYELL